MKIRRLGMKLTLTVGALTAARGVAHEFWLEPTTHHAAPNAIVRLGLRVGEDFHGAVVPRDPNQIERFVRVGPDGEAPILGLEGRDPAGLLRMEKPGLYVLGYRSRGTAIQLPADKFEHYLAEDGLEAVSAARQARGEREKPGRESYSRCAKALLQVGAGDDAGFDRALGFTLELIPEQNPLRLAPGEELTVRLLYEGRPLAGALVVATSRAAPRDAIRVRSDPDGRVRFKLTAGGRWMISAVHMVPARAAAAVADWESLWASLTFETRAE